MMLRAVLLLMVSWVGLAGAVAAQGAAGSVVASIEAYNRGDVAAAFRLLKAASDAGNSDAQVNLGYLYARGHGVTENQQEAMRLYLLSAKQGNAEGMNAVAYKYRTAAASGSTCRAPCTGSAVPLSWVIRAASTISASCITRAPA